MPPVALAIAPYVGGMLIASIIVQVVSSIAISVVLGALSAALTKKPKAPAAIGNTDRSITVRQPITYHQLIIGQVKTGGAYTFMKSYDTNKRLEIVITLAGHPSQSIDKIYFDDGLITIDGSGNVTSVTAPDGTVNTNWNGFAKVVAGLGTTATDAAFMTYGMQQAPGDWTANHKQTNCTKIWVTFKSNTDLYSGSIPNVSVVMSGLKPYDPRTHTSPWSANPVLALRYYMQHVNITQVDLSDVDDTVNAASANVCDETVTLKAGGTETRYTANGIIDTSQDPQTIIPELLTSMNGKLVWIGGKWKILAGSYRTPTISFDEGDLDGGIRTTTRVSMRELFNGVKGTYYSPAAAWQPTDFTAVKNASYLAEDGGVEVWSDVTYPFTITDTMCQRLGKQSLEAVRRQITTYWPVKLTGLQVQAGDVVYLNRSRYGWVNKPFEVTDWQFSVRGQDQDIRLGIDLTLRETDSGVYAWNSGDESTGPTIATTNLPSVWTVGMPGVPSISEQNYITRDSSGVKTKVTSTWPAAVDGFVSDYQLEYRAVGTTDYTVLPKVKATSTIINDVAPGYYDWRVKSINSVGISSGYAYTLNKEVRGLGDRPIDPTGFTLQVAGGVIIAHWTQATDLDVLIGGSVLLRHSEKALASATWENSVTITPNIPGSANSATAPLKAGTYLIKFQDSLGLTSVNFAAVSTKDVDAWAFVTSVSATEDPSFTGTHSNTTSVDGYIKLLGAGLFSGIADFDLITGLDSYGGVATAGTYTFANAIDLGSVGAARLTTSLDVLAVNVLDNFDARTGTVDDWLDWDGAAGGAADAWIEVRTTDDNPAGSPTWGPWNRLVQGNYYNRAFQFRCQLTSMDPTINIHILKLGVTASHA